MKVPVNESCRFNRVKRMKSDSRKFMGNCKVNGPLTDILIAFKIL